MCFTPIYFIQTVVASHIDLTSVRRYLLLGASAFILALPLVLNPSKVSSALLSQSVPFYDKLSEPSSIHPNQLILGVQPEQTEKALHEFLTTHGLKLVKEWPDLHSVLVEIIAPQDEAFHINPAQQKNEQSTARLLAHLKKARHDLEQLSDLRYVTYNRRIYAADFVADTIQRNSPVSPHQIQATHPISARIPNIGEKNVENSLPNDPEFSNQWPLPMVQVVESWEISRGDSNVVIAVIDSGYNMSHPDLDQDSIWENKIEAAGLPGVDDDGNGYIDDRFGWDWIDNDNDFSNDTYGHGTHVGGTIAATTNNGIGIAGIGHDIKIMPLRILDGQGAGYIDALVDALAYADREQVRIINLSLVLEFDSPILAEVFANYVQKMLIISATGNQGRDVFWPAQYEGTVAVGATDSTDSYSSLSNFGPMVDLAAPGINILSTGSNKLYLHNSGTSMATAHVSGLAGLVHSLRPDFSVGQILDVIKQSAVDINGAEHPGRDDFIGSGRIDFYKTLQNASIGLQLLKSEFPFDIVPQYPIDSRIEVLTPATATSGAIPVRGAVVRYELFLTNGVDNNVDNVTPTLSGQSITNKDGVAFITFFAPSTTGRYLFRSTVGLETVEQPLTIFPAPYSVDISASTLSLLAGNGSTLLSTEVRDEDGDFILMPQPLRLETNYGSFANGQQSIDVLLNNGIYTTTFYAERQTGVATIHANLADILNDSEQIHVVANQAASIKLLSDRSRLNTTSGETVATISILVYDAYGNILERVVTVEMYTSMGEITPSVVWSASPIGMSAALTVSPNSIGEATIWAALPSRQLLTKLKINVSDKPINTTLLPFVIRP